MSKETKDDQNNWNFYFKPHNHLNFLAIIKASIMFTLGRKNKYFVNLVKKQWLNRSAQGTRIPKKLFPVQRSAE